MHTSISKSTSTARATDRVSYRSGRPHRILYLHGFRSSSASRKALQFRAWLAHRYPLLELVTPDLPPSPRAAADLIDACLQGGDGVWRGIVGSSLGGYYAAHAGERHGLPAVLVNPAVHPCRLFEAYVGEHVNLYTGERFELKREYLQELERLDTPRLRAPGSMLLLLQTADETLDYQEALNKYPNSPAWIQAGGSHEFLNFEAVLEGIVRFLMRFEESTAHGSQDTPA